MAVSPAPLVGSGVRCLPRIKKKRGRGYAVPDRNRGMRLDGRGVTRDLRAVVKLLQRLCSLIDRDTACLDFRKGRES